MKKLAVMMAGGAFLLAGFTASATPLTYLGVWGNKTTTLKVTAPGVSYNGGVYTGFYQYKVGSSSTVVNSFCVDFYDESTKSTEDYTAIPLADAPMSLTPGATTMGTSAANTIEALWALYYNQALTDATGGNYATSASLQIAIWEAIATGMGGTATTSPYNSGPDYQTLATTMLGNAANYTGPLPDLFAWGNAVSAGKYQDYIGVPDGGMTAALLGGAFLGLEALRRKRKLCC